MQDIIDEAIARNSQMPQGVGALELSFDNRESATAILTRQGGSANEQQVIQLDPGKKTMVTLPSGRYAVAVTSPGASTQRIAVDVDLCTVPYFHASLTDDAAPPLTFEQELDRLGLAPPGGELTELALADGEDLELSPSGRFEAATYLAEITDLDRAKELLGVPDDRWPEGYSRYGELVDPDEQDRAEILSGPARHALREYISGNSTTVGAWREILDDYVKSDTLTLPIYLFRTITVGPCATLKVGRAGLWCWTLQVHATATIKITDGPCHIHAAFYEGV